MLSKVVPSTHYKTHQRFHRNFFSLQKILLYLEGLINRLVSPKFNPFYYLGAIATIFFTVLLISGIYLFIFYRTNNPYQTVQDITEKQWYIGSLMRSLHRYSSDGFIISIILHLIREFLYGRYSNNRWLAWVSGVILFIISLILGISGYWLVWDERAQLIALKTSELLNDVPFFIEPPSRSFLNNESLSGMLFFLLHFLHSALPLALIILIGVHIMRCSRPTLKTPRIMTIAVITMLLMASTIIPAASAKPADLTRLPINTPFDWFFFFIYPVKSTLPKPIFWLITTGATMILFIMPWIKRHRPPAAQVILEKCTGCDQCNKDCPYGAIRLQPYTDRLAYKMEAVIMPERCTACGICVGACDFNAVNLPNMTDTQIKEEIINLLSDIQLMNRKPKILLLICERSVQLNVLLDITKGMANVKLIALPCIGMVQPSMIETGFRSGADGVLLCGCIIGDCHYRKGNIWLQSRIRDMRPPFLNKTIDRQRIREYWLSPIHTERVIEEILLFEEYLNTYNRSGQNKFKVIKPTLDRKMIFKKALAFAAAFPAILIFLLSTEPTFPFYSKDKSLIKFTFKHSGKQEDCRELTEEETMSKLRHMRKTNSPFSKIRMECKRKRLPIYVELDLDGRNILSRTYYPTGMRKDGSTFAYEEISVSPETHEIIVRMRDSGKGNTFNYIIKKKIDAMPGKVTLIDMSRTFLDGAST